MKEILKVSEKNRESGAEEILKAIVEYIKNDFGLDVEVELSSNFREELNIDSLDIASLEVFLDDKYKINIDEKKYFNDKIITVEDLVKIVQEELRLKSKK